MNRDNDVFGKAIEDYTNRPNSRSIKVHSPGFDEDEIPVHYLFRAFSEMPKIEQQALALCKGNILDVGCGAGAHSLYLQQIGKEVKAIDISPKAIEICRQRGIDNTAVQDFFQMKNQRFSTLLFLMNGIGIVGKLAHMDAFFEQLNRLLKPNGQVLLDSSDLIYLFENTHEDIKNNPIYYGEMEYQISYLDAKSKPFNWLYIDFEMLSYLADLHGYKAEKMIDGEHYDYLARLTLKTNST